MSLEIIRPRANSKCSSPLGDPTMDCGDALSRYNILVWVLFGMTIFMIVFRVAARRHIMAGNGKAGMPHGLLSRVRDPRRTSSCEIRALLPPRAPPRVRASPYHIIYVARRQRARTSHRAPRCTPRETQVICTTSLISPSHLPTGSTTNTTTAGSDATRPCAHFDRADQNGGGDLSPDRLEPGVW